VTRKIKLRWKKPKRRWVRITKPSLEEFWFMLKQGRETHEEEIDTRQGITLDYLPKTRAGGRSESSKEMLMRLLEN